MKHHRVPLLFAVLALFLIGPAHADAPEQLKKAGEEMKNGIGMTLCWMPAGKFTMGSPEGIAPEESQVEVELTSGFWMGKFEVTQEEYKEIDGGNPARFKEIGNPVERVSWEDAVEFCENLNERERKLGKLLDGWAYTLPTEAQWEYACRAGKKGPFSGDKLDDVGWYMENSGGKTHAVGEKKSNAWGLYDMHGNVREWCLDWYAEKLPGGKDPIAPKRTSLRIFRGGDWSAEAHRCRAAKRLRNNPRARGGSVVGFRVSLCPTQ